MERKILEHGKAPTTERTADVNGHEGAGRLKGVGMVVAVALSLEMNISLASMHQNDGFCEAYCDGSRSVCHSAAASISYTHS